MIKAPAKRQGGKKSSARKGPARKRPAASGARGSGSAAAKKSRGAGKDVSQLEEQLCAVRAIGASMATAVGLDALLEQIVPDVSRLMRATRTTLFLYNGRANEIWSKVAEGESTREIRLQMGQGIAGWVAEHRQITNVPDAYADARFHSDVDAETGFRTRSVVAAPVLGRDGELLGVLQVLNRRGGPFTPEDVELLRAIAAQTAYAVENARLAQRLLDQNRELEAARERAERRRAELDFLYQLEQETSRSTELDELLDSIIVRVCDRLRSEAGSVMLADRDTGRLFFRGVTGSAKEQLKQMTLGVGEGVVGWVAQHGEPLVVNRPEDDPRHHRGLAQEISFPAHALLAVPLIWDSRVIGAMEVLNPRPRASGANGYDLGDLKVLTLIAGQVARAVALTLERQARMDTDRLAVIGRMLASVAHDLRNPMTAISGYAQLMAVDDDDASRRDRCGRILGQIDEMTAMIFDLLAFARGDSCVHPTAVDIRQLATDAREALGPRCEPLGIALSVAAAEGHAIVDLGRAKRILFNLAKNAIEVLGGDGLLSIDLAEENGGLRMRVADNGPGLPDQVRSRLFEPFVSTGKENGTGLGLSIVKRFVDDHGGRIDVESGPGAGTAFLVQLPRVAARTQVTE